MLYHSATANAARSPLLLLPPEIRCRIWDYAFSGYFFHISSTGFRREQGCGLKPMCYGARRITWNASQGILPSKC